MPLREQKGNMYTFVTHTWNPIKGRCSHDCSYCYMKRFPQKEIRLDEQELKTDLGQGNYIFVGSSTDMFADAIPNEWIIKVLQHCERYPGNTYLFQSKNPWKLKTDFSLKGVYGTTIETNRKYPCMGKAPRITDRINAMQYIRKHGHRTMITIEPILDFDLRELILLIANANPEWVNIGSDSGHNNLPEPSEDKIRELVKDLSKITNVKRKDNLHRLLKQEKDGTGKN